MCLGEATCEPIGIVEDAVRAITLFLLDLAVEEILIIEPWIMGAYLLANMFWILP